MNERCCCYPAIASCYSDEVNNERIRLNVVCNGDEYSPVFEDPVLQSVRCGSVPDEQHRVVHVHGTTRRIIVHPLAVGSGDSTTTKSGNSLIGYTGIVCYLFLVRVVKRLSPTWLWLQVKWTSNCRLYNYTQAKDTSTKMNNTMTVQIEAGQT